MATINITIPNASETAKGIVEEATQAQVTAGTDTGETGARLFVAPSKLQSALSGKVDMTTFTTNGSGVATVAALIGKTAGTNMHLFEYSTGGAGTLLGTSRYTFNSGTGAFSGLSPSTPYLVFYE